MQQIKEHPILFSGPMVRAILDGSKTQTRRVIKPQPTAQLYSVDSGSEWAYPDPHDPCVPDWDRVCLCPYGSAGDRLWVRETWRHYPQEGRTVYRADGEEDVTPLLTWRPSIHMPRWASRITLIIESIRVERLQDITEEDAQAEGMAAWGAAYCSRRPEDELYMRAYFELAWGQINGKRYPWESNPFCWIIEFKRL